MLQEPLHSLDSIRQLGASLDGLGRTCAALAPAVLQRLADPGQGPPAALAFLTHQSLQRGPGWAQEGLPSLIDWLAESRVALLPCESTHGSDPCRASASAGPMPPSEAAAGASHGSQHHADNHRELQGWARGFGVAPRALGFPPQLQLQLRRLLAALPRCPKLYDTLDERRRRVLDELLAALPGAPAAAPAPGGVLGGVGRVGGLHAPPGRMRKYGGTGEDSRTIPTSEVTRSGEPGGGRGSRGVGTWVQAALAASRMRYQGPTAGGRLKPLAPQQQQHLHQQQYQQIQQPYQRTALVSAARQAHPGAGTALRPGSGAHGCNGLKLQDGPDTGGHGAGGTGAYGISVDPRDDSDGGAGDGGWWWFPEPPSTNSSSSILAVDCVKRIATDLDQDSDGDPVDLPQTDPPSAPATPKETVRGTAGRGGGARKHAGTASGLDQEAVEVGRQPAVDLVEAAGYQATTRCSNLAEEGGLGAGTSPPPAKRMRAAAPPTSSSSPPPQQQKQASESRAQAQPPLPPVSEAYGGGGGGGRGAGADDGGAGSAPTITEVLQLLRDAVNGSDHITTTPDTWRRLEALLERCAATAAGGGGTSGLIPATAAGFSADAVTFAPDQALHIVRQLVTPRLSGAAARLLLSAAVLPAVVAVERVMSRPLQEALIAAAALHPRPVAEALLVPVVQRPGLTAGQAQLLTKVATTGTHPLPQPLQALVLRAAASCGPEWREPHLAVAQGLVEAAKEGLDQGTLELLCEGVRAAIRGPQQLHMARSVPLCRLLLSVLSKQGGDLRRAQLAQLHDAASATSTFMTKPCLAKLQELLDRS